MPTRIDEGALDGVSFLAGGPEALAAAPVRAFGEATVELLSEVSARLLSAADAREMPDVVSFAFWCRRANVARLASGYPDAPKRIGRGLALHIAPSNVPVNFAFSWAFSQLAGNCDVVRVPMRTFPQVDTVCRAVEEAMGDAGCVRSAFVRYPSDGPTTARLSRAAEARIVWGGDATVAAVRALPCPPRCVDVMFPDRYSAAFIDEGPLADLDDAGVARLAKGLYNDTYLMDQNACSSPRAVFWLGSDPAQRARLLGAVRARAEAEYDLQGAVSVDKYVRLCEDAAAGRIARPLAFDGCLTAVPLEGIPEDLPALRGYGGYLYEIEDAPIADALASLGPRCQTVVYWGVDPERLRAEALRAGCPGVERIVPVGKAMDMGPVWDGHDLPRALSRLIEVV